MILLFWLCAVFILYCYIGYPALLFVWSRIRPHRVRRGHRVPVPKVSVVIAAHNEADNLPGRLDNLCDQDYEPDRMEIIVVSDGSTDNSPEVVRGYLETGQARATETGRTFPRIRLIVFEENRGKALALNAGVGEANGDFIVLADARQRFNRDAIRELIANFNDPEVGCVSGELVFVDADRAGAGGEMKAYWNMEKAIRKMESAIHSVAGATGSICAIRKELYRNIPPNTLLDDVFIPMNIVFQGYRSVFEERAVAMDSASKTMAQEKRRKLRTLLGNYQIIELMPRLISPGHNPIFFRYLSHKIFRLGVPLAFLTMMLAALASGEFFYRLIFCFGVAAMLLPLMEDRLKPIPFVGKLCTLSSAFFLLNYFALLAFWHFLFAKNKEIW